MITGVLGLSTGGSAGKLLSDGRSEESSGIGQTFGRCISVSSFLSLIRD